jgi:hypothetical protein
LVERTVEHGALQGVPAGVSGMPAAGSPGVEAARDAIMQCIQDACDATLSEALAVQTKYSAGFMVSAACHEGSIGADYTKTMVV